MKKSLLYCLVWGVKWFLPCFMRRAMFLILRYIITCTRPAKWSTPLPFRLFLHVDKSPNVNYGALCICLCRVTGENIAVERRWPTTEWRPQVIGIPLDWSCISSHVTMCFCGLMLVEEWHIIHSFLPVTFLTLSACQTRARIYARRIIRSTWYWPMLFIITQTEEVYASLILSEVHF